MTTSYLRTGKSFTPADTTALNIHTELPPGNYIIQVNERGVFYFEQVDGFEPPAGKIYGDTTKNAERILNTFFDRPNSTGVMLTGEKGSGKTLLAKLLSISCFDKGIPTIIINQPYVGDEFNKLIQNINQPCVILFDEFEKVYCDAEKQAAMLTLLDGVFPSKKLFLLTCNDSYRIDAHMHNRPGRIFYMLKFSGLDKEFIIDYCNDKLNDKTQINDICRIAMLIAEFNFDILKALVEDMNRYNEPAIDVMKMLNASPQAEHLGQYRVALSINGKVINPSDYYPTTFRGNPLAQQLVSINYYPNIEEESEDGETCRRRDREQEFGFTYADLKKVDAEQESLQFAKDGMVVTFTRIRVADFNYKAF